MCLDNISIEVEEKKKRRQDVWNEKHELVSRTYKLQKEIADEFKSTCEKVGISQKKQLEIMMTQFIKEKAEH